MQATTKRALLDLLTLTAISDFLFVGPTFLKLPLMLNLEHLIIGIADDRLLTPSHVFFGALLHKEERASVSTHRLKF